MEHFRLPTRQVLTSYEGHLVPILTGVFSSDLTSEYPDTLYSTLIRPYGTVTEPDSLELGANIKTGKTITKHQIISIFTDHKWPSTRVGGTPRLEPHWFHS